MWRPLANPSANTIHQTTHTPGLLNVMTLLIPAMVFDHNWPVIAFPLHYVKSGDHMRILMVCLGNICRSPMAEGILRAMTTSRGLEWDIDSAGTGAWHSDEPPDPRAIAVCKQRGLDIRQLRARQVRRQDFDAFDLILTMDRANHRDVLQMAQSASHKDKIRPIMSYASDPYAEVPDPYYDGRFAEVYELLIHVCDRIVAAHTMQGDQEI